MLAQVVAYRSLSLERFSVCFMVDARQFFQACEPTWTWDDMQDLQLTSQLLTDAANRDEISDLLCRGGEVALNMPKLGSMTLWNGRKGEAGAFIYRKKSKEDGRPLVTWCGTWDPELQSHVIAAWNMVAAKFTRYNIRVEYDWISGDGIESTTDAMAALKLV
jgi:hypothetical protein